MKISSSRSHQPHVHLVRKPSGIARRIRKNQLGTGRFAVSWMKVAQPTRNGQECCPLFSESVLGFVKVT
ncbi:MAG: hypothetical protein LBJ67_05735 [Planctomycetaceae bacterium]|nr:hypothetical protein [Planctomycetaceae bacterium]